jgi:acetylornithine deacetylase/succinyl-diaminopimelate desuccinylase-like protein
VVVAHKGVVRWRSTTRGRAAHSAQPETGQNAIYRMARVLVAIERYQEEVVGTLGSHPLCGPATLSVGTIAGGVSVNTVPDRCTIEIDRRLAGCEEPGPARRHLIEYLRRQCDAASWLEHEPPFMSGLALGDDANGPLAERLSAAAREVAGACRRVGVSYATDAAVLAAAGVPAVVFGPGSIAQAHTADEWIDLDEVRQAAEIYYRFAAGAEQSRDRRSRLDEREANS